MLVFIMNSALLGVGLAMDAFSVSLANGLNEPRMKFGRMMGIAGTFAVFQGVMPMTGWICVHTIAQKFKAFEKFIPWIALILLAYIGGKMLKEGIEDFRAEKAEAAAEAEGSKPEHPDTAIESDDSNNSNRAKLVKSETAAEAGESDDSNNSKRAKLGFAELMVQGIATSIDALSVGFTIADYELGMAIGCALIIAALTLIICLAGLKLGKTFGTKLAGKASILGGVILIGIGIEIFVSGVFF